MGNSSDFWIFAVIKIIENVLNFFIVIFILQSVKSHYSPYASKEVEKLSMLNQTREFELDDAFENNSYESVRI